MYLLQSHHKPREGPFELNDVFAIINAVPAIALMAFGFFNKGFIPGLTFGAVSGVFS
jgi:beta-carotene 3-hydroxylase